MPEDILSNVADVKNEEKGVIFLRAGQQHLNKNGGWEEDQLHYKTNKQPNPKDKKNPKPQSQKNPNQPTQQLGAMFLEIALKYETIKINLN